MTESAEREAKLIVDAVRTGGKGAIDRFIDEDLKQLPAQTEHRYRVARRFVLVGRALNVFNHGDEQYLSRTVHEAMLEAERAFSEADRAGAEFDRAEHLVRVVAALVEREAPKFAADPQAWIKTWREDAAVRKAKREQEARELEARKQEWLRTAPEIAIVDVLIRWIKDGGVHDYQPLPHGRPRDVMLAAL
jgi:hypothetical protein